MSKKTELARPPQIEELFANITKEFGEGSVIDLARGTLPNIEFTSSGSISIDRALGGGYPRGRIIEIYGVEMGGKTTAALHAVAEAQKQFPDKFAGIIDAEHCLDINYARNLGVNLDKVIISQPSSGEDALSILEMMIRSGMVSIAVVDSVAALAPKAELEGEMGDQQPGLQARLMSKALRKITAIAAQTDTTVIFINQLRNKIGGYGNPETTGGGLALKFYASQRLEIRRTEKVIEDGVAIANGARIKVVKNKVSPPYREAEVYIKFGEGIDRFSDLVSVAAEDGIIDKAGAWFSYNGDKIGQGLENAAGYIKQHPELYNEIYNKLVAIQETS